MGELTEGRRDALGLIADGRIKKTWPLKAATPPKFIDSRNFGALRKGVAEWLIDNGYARLDAPNLRGTLVVLTAKGHECLNTEKEEEK